MIDEAQRRALLEWRTPERTFEVEKGAILRYAETTGDRNPLWTDDAQARRSPHSGLVAMPLFLTYFNPFHWGTPRPEAALRKGASAGETFEFLAPVRPGDVITVTERFVDMYEKQGRNGPLVFTIDERVYTNQRGERVGRSNWTEAGRSEAPLHTADKVATAAKEAPPRRIRVSADTPAAQPTSVYRGVRYFEDVEVGAEIEPLICPLSHDLFVRFAACNNEFARHHVDYLYARETGWPDCIAQGLLGTAYLGRMVTDWIGASGRLTRLGVSYRAPGFPGEEWRCTGRVAARHSDTNELDLEIRILNQDKRVATQGTASVHLPTRAA